MKATLAQVCTLNAPFAADIADYAAAGCRQIEIWFGKLETYLDAHTVDRVRRLLDEHQVDAPVASYQGGLTARGAARAQAWELFERRLEICRQLALGTLVVTVDQTSTTDPKALRHVRDALAEAAGRASECGVRLALEFQARAAFCNNLETAAALVEQTGSPHLGVCLDAFHFFTGPSKLADLNHLSTENLFHVQLCDLTATPRELATGADRVLPGDGDLDLTPVIDRLRAIRYEGPVSVELMNPQLWQVPTATFAHAAMSALRRTLGQALPDDLKSPNT